MSNNINEHWLSRQELANRYGLPVKTLAQWASKGTGPRYARMGRHVRYRLSDVIDWEAERVNRWPHTSQCGAPEPDAVPPGARAGSQTTQTDRGRNER